MADGPQRTDPNDEQRLVERREFLRRCGKFASVVPPAMTLLLVDPKTSRAENFPFGSNNPFGDPDFPFGSNNPFN